MIPIRYRLVLAILPVVFVLPVGEAVAQAPVIQCDIDEAACEALPVQPDLPALVEVCGTDDLNCAANPPEVAPDPDNAAPTAPVDTCAVDDKICEEASSGLAPVDAEDTCAGNPFCLAYFPKPQPDQRPVDCGPAGEFCRATVPSGPDPTIVDICDTHPEACLASREGPTERPSPICELDPCACEDCSDANRLAGLFENAPDRASVNLASSPNMVGVEIVSTAPPEPIYDGAFSSVAPDAEAAVATFRLDRAIAAAQMKRNARSGLVCNRKGQRPLEYWRELMLRRKELAECSEAAGVMLEQRSQYQQGYFDSLAGKLKKKQAKTLFNVFEDYRKACLHELDELKQTAAMSSSLGGAFLKEIKANVGQLNFTGKSVHCTASIVRQTQGNAFTLGIVTAAHCVGEPTTGAGLGKLQYGSVHPEMVFTSFAGKQYKVEIAADLRGFVYNAEQDVVVIPLVSSPTPAGPQLGFEIAPTPNIWEPLYLVGVNPFLAALSAATTDEPIELIEAASVSFEPACRVYGINGSTILHNCQTEKSMSGSPIFVSSGGKAKLVGVHSGETEKPTFDGCKEPSASAANFGTLLSP